MYCSKCGNDMPDQSEVCPACGYNIDVSRAADGRQIASAPVSQQVPPGYVQNTAAPSSAGHSQTHGDYNKLGGWLLFFVVWWVFSGVSNMYSGLSGIESINHRLSFFGDYGNVLMAFFAVQFFAGIPCLLLCWHIYKRNHVFLRFYQLYIVALAVIYIILIVAALSTMDGQGVSYGMDLSQSLIGGIIGLVGGAVIMTMYFCKSERVRTYMGGVEYMMRAIFRIGA